MIVHDLRSPLMIVSGYLALLEEHEAKKLSESGAAFIRQAGRSLADLVDMVDSMLDAGKMEAGEMKLNRSDCDLDTLIRTTIEKVEPLVASRILTVATPEQPVRLSADTGLLSRVVRNLLGNALKFTPDQGSVRIGISASGREARVTVSDDGPGIPAEYHQKIFEKFGQVEDTRAKAGTGLGLAFCRLAVELHGGRIGVESEVGKGSTFWFTLPLTAV